MADSVDLERPEAVEDVDENAPAYRRVVAVLVVLITFFGSIVAYLQARESNDEDIAARDAQRDAVAGLGAQVDATADFAADLRIGSQIDIALQREALSASRILNSNPDDPLNDIRLAARDRFAQVREAIAAFTPIDPADPATFNEQFAIGNESADEARLRQGVEADLADDHGGKADRYVAVLTVLAVALFLLGLSLTVQGRTRYVLAVPGVAIGLACVAWAWLIASAEVTRVTPNSVRLVAEGLRFANAGDFEAAIDAYDAAIEESPNYAIAYARRSDARFLQGAAQIGQTQFVSITSEDALEDAIEDSHRALELGADDDLETVADAGFLAFLDGDFDRSADLSRAAIELNDQIATVWFNLGLAEVAQGDERAAAAAYREGRRLLSEGPGAEDRSAVLAGARTDLSILREILDDDELDEIEDLILATEAELAAFEAPFLVGPCDTGDCPSADEVGDGALLADPSFTSDGATVFLEVTVEGVEAGTPITTVWYLRTDDEVPYQQAAIPVVVPRAGEGGVVFSSTLPSFTPACPVPGDYLVRVYADDEFLGEVEGTIEPGLLGSEFFSSVDPVEGYDACVPAGFEVLQADVTDVDSFTSFVGTDFAIGLNVTPGALLEGVDPEESTRETLAGTLGVDVDELVPVDFSARDVNGNFQFVPGFAAVSEEQNAAIALSVGPDGASRNVIITGSSDLALLVEAIALIQFTGLPAA